MKLSKPSRKVPKNSKFSQNRVSCMVGVVVWSCLFGDGLLLSKKIVYYNSIGHIFCQNKLGLVHSIGFFTCKSTQSYNKLIRQSKSAIRESVAALVSLGLGGPREGGSWREEGMPWFVRRFLSCSSCFRFFIFSLAL